jgi:hypothetical protein
MVSPDVCLGHADESWGSSWSHHSCIKDVVPRSSPSRTIAPCHTAALAGSTWHSEGPITQARYVRMPPVLSTLSTRCARCLHAWTLSLRALISLLFSLEGLLGLIGS